MTQVLICSPYTSFSSLTLSLIAYADLSYVVSTCFQYNVIFITQYSYSSFQLLPRQSTRLLQHTLSTTTLLDSSLLLYNVSPAASTLLHTLPRQLDSSTDGHTTTISAAHGAVVEQDTQQSGTGHEPFPTDTIQLVSLPASPVESSTEEDNRPFRIIDVWWEEEV